MGFRRGAQLFARRFGRGTSFFVQGTLLLERSLSPTSSADCALTMFDSQTTKGHRWGGPSEDG
jgi:hypothetical protein